MLEQGGAQPCFASQGGCYDHEATASCSFTLALLIGGVNSATRFGPPFGPPCKLFELLHLEPTSSGFIFVWVICLDGKREVNLSQD